MTASYREHFAEKGSANAYDDGQYGRRSFWETLWRVEREILDRIVEQQRARTGRVDYLDFACGTGRVLAHLEGRCETARGIDVSAEMLERARKRVTKADLVCADVTAPGAAIEARYDLITAFRFLLNAEPSLRSAGMRALALRLKGPDSRLVVNTHGNPYSYKGIVVPIRRLLRSRGGAEGLLPASAVEKLLDDAGLEPVARYGMGFLPGPFLRGMPERLAYGLEVTMSRWPVIHRLGVNQILVCRPRRGTAWG